MLKNLIAKGLPISVFTSYYLRLSHIDFQMENTIVPINTALKLAIEDVMNYYNYRSLADEIRGVA